MRRPVAWSGRGSVQPRFAVGLLLLAILSGGAAEVSAQERPSLRFSGPGGDSRAVEVASHRAYFAVPAAALTGLGWTVEEEGSAWRLGHPDGTVLSLTPGHPFFRWGGELLQLVSPPYLFGQDLYLPLQLLVDFFPRRLPDVYGVEEIDGASLVLRVSDADHWADPAGSPTAPLGQELEEQPEARPEVAEPDPVGPEVPRVVVVDPGHGGRDPGALGPGGAQEKDVALELGRALARALRRYPGLEVHLTRESDVLVPLWERGEWATERKGDRPGIFISLHANALPAQPGARGFETYFLSEARTEHERRVAANENAPLAIEGGEEAPAENPDLSFILKELRNLDHQHWSSLLAELIQNRVSPVHPGPDRGVKQGPFAVITNALMPAVLVEIGFISNPAEERVLTREAFQRDIARALARAVADFFERYPPEQGAEVGAGGSRESGA